MAACGSSSTSSSADAQSLLKQTFSGSHKVTSGVLTFNLTMNPSGSSTVKGPITLSLSGPFQSRGKGNLPESNFTISASALGHHGQLGVVSTGTNGYVVLKGAAYQLPAADFSKLKSSFSASSNGSTTTGGLSKFGIDPLHWLTNPTTVGSDSVAGTPTTHIRAAVNVSALLSDLDTFLQKAAATGAAGSSSIPTTIPPATRDQIANSIKNPTVDVWTGNSDKTLRKLSLNLNVPVTGQSATALGGLTSAGIGMTLQYANLNQPQTISAPANVKPFTEFAAKLQSVLQQVQGSLGAGLGATTGTGTSTSSGSSANPSKVQKYTQCIQQAGGDVTKMQKCASLLQGG
ncbi:MAG TPA: hypothetical protein VGL51_16980 [Solirubrobacteraceae bacterium]